jgi:diacylglycerol kinase family enzyme
VLDGSEIIVAVGGDGTMNEVAQGVVDTPAGLALHLGVPRSPFAALLLATGAGGRIAAVDTGTANGLPFFNAMELGLDADVSRRFNGLARRGLPAYARVAFTALRELRPQRCRISAAGRVETLDVLLVAIANSDQYGNHARIAPGARVDDGRLELVAIKAVGLAAAAALVPRLFLGNVDQSPDVMRLSGPRFVIERPAPGLIHTDGGDVHYLNSGDWVESLTAIVEHWDGRYELIEFARKSEFGCAPSM